MSGEQSIAKATAPERIKWQREHYACYKPDCQAEHDAEYVRQDIAEARVAAVWEQAMLIIHEVPREQLTGLVSDALKHDRMKLLHALEAARAAGKGGEVNG